MGEYLFIGSALFSVVNGIVVLNLNPRRTVNRVFFATALWVGAWSCCIAWAILSGRQFQGGDSSEVLRAVRYSTAVAAYFGWLGWLMRCALVKEQPTLSELLKESWFWFLVSTSTAFLSLTELYIPSSSTPDHRQYGVGYGVYVLVAFASCSWMIFDALKQHKHLSGVRKLEMQMYVITLTSACILVLVSNFAGIFFRADWTKRLCGIWFVAAHATTAWAICYEKVFDAKHLVLSGVKYVALTLVAAITAVVIYTFSRGIMQDSLRLSVSAGLACVACLLFERPIKRSLGLDSRAVIGTNRAKLIGWTKVANDENTIRTNCCNLLQQMCGTSLVLFHHVNLRKESPVELQFPDDWIGFKKLAKDGCVTPETLERSRKEDASFHCSAAISKLNLGALIAVPRNSEHPTLLIGLGKKNNFRPYTYPELKLLVELAELMDNILTHARVAAHAAHIEKMEVAAMLSRSLAHDLNNLATPLSSFISESERKEEPKVEKDLNVIHAREALNAIQNYISESLFFSRKHAPQFSDHDLAVTIKEVVSLARVHGETRNVRFETTVPDTFDVTADRALLMRMLQNLTYNAIDAAPAYSFVKVELAPVNADWFEIRVCDQGGGVPPMHLPHIFEPYYTTKDASDSSRGLGLGLAVAHKVAELHAGSIAVRPNFPAGSIFAVRLPASLHRPAPADGSPATDTTPAPGENPASSKPNQADPT